ncbi:MULTISPECIES: ABC transporter permease [Desulfosediminicola]|uniref:ABC transporter permease n=1 Tax=Desulfosediminicola TaxID=2886823 RepID=UPI0010ABE0C1|nr:ABC transporter permease [Desulfosediminicola ganghwensis]
MHLPSFQRIWALFVARNHEFFRDKAAFGWNFAFPFLLIVGIGLVFNHKDLQHFKVGVFPVSSDAVELAETTIPKPFYESEHLTFIPMASYKEGERKLSHHKIDLLLDATSRNHTYWINDSSPSGALAEKIFIASFLAADEVADKQLIEGEQIRYIDWLFPGILAMNMMFSALWGVGYVVVRYRKNGTLKRLKATPLTAFEYLTAQMLSRIFLLMFTLLIVWLGADLIFNFQVQGSYLLLAFIFLLGGLNLSSIGLILAARGTSEEFTSGVLNFISLPMMFLSEVWFSLEGSPRWVLMLSDLFPLTHLLRAARMVMSEAATLRQVQWECAILLFSTLIFLSIAAKIFSWNE